MRVFVFGIRGFPFIGGGAERHSEELYPRLVKHFDITVLCRRYIFPEWKRVKFIRLPYINNRYLETLSHSIICSFYCLIKRPDIVHIHNMGAFLLIPLLSFSGIKVIITIHSLNYQHKKWGHFGRWVLNTLENIGISFCHQIIVVSKEIRDHLRDKFPRAIPLHIIPNGVNEPEYTPAGLTLRKYKLKQKRYILAVGRLVPEKGFDRLVQCYKAIPEPDYKLVIVGNGERDSDYKRELIVQGDSNIIFTGFLCGKELAELYTNAGLFVSTSFNEGFPLVVLEAMSYGLPMLLSNILAHREIKLRKFRYFKSTKELPAKIEYAMRKGITAKEQQNYRHLLREYYNWESVAKSTRGMYDF